MNLMEKINENIKRGIRSWLNVSPANPYVFNINEMMDFEGNAIRNRIWYRGDSNELEQFYEQDPHRCSGAYGENSGSSSPSRYGGI